jgi:transposase
MAASRVLVADRWFPSTKLCSECGAKNGALTVSERIWPCGSCGTSHDRDVNAARNLARDMLLDLVWRSDRDVSPQTVETYTRIQTERRYHDGSYVN